MATGFNNGSLVIDDASTSRTNLGLGTIATQASSSVTITGGTINGITIGGSVPGAITGTDITATNAASGATRLVTCENTNNTANSAAQIKASTAGSTAGDPTFQATTTATTWTWGSDNSVTSPTADPFVLSQGTTLGTNNVMSVATSGEINYPLQPAFLAYKSSTSTNVTGDGTVYTIICDTEIFDQNSDYNNSTGIFTAPVTGRYEFNLACLTVGGSTLTNFSTLRLNTSNRLYASYMCIPFAGSLYSSFSVIADMDANDTAQMDISANDTGGKIVDVYGDSTVTTFFSGNLVC
jgi:hypothetical protein